MKTRFLLPFKYKKIGQVFMLIGFLIWIVGQKGWLNNIIIRLVPYKITVVSEKQLSSNQQQTLSIFLIIAFILFTLGILLKGLSKEKNEDEYIKNIKLESFRMAAWIQGIIIFVILWINIITKDQYFETLTVEVFPWFLILIFWLVYEFRVEYILCWPKMFSSYKQNEKQSKRRAS